MTVTKSFGIAKQNKYYLYNDIMKAFTAIFNRGHFIDKETQKRIIPRQGYSYTLSGIDSAFKEDDERLGELDCLSANEKRMALISKHGEFNIKLILKQGTELNFSVGNDKKLKTDSSGHYFFTCEILEDLYIYCAANKSGEKKLHWRMAECTCQLKTCTTGGLTLTEKIKAKSLNKIFSNTVMFYFPLQRSGSINVFTSFFISDPKGYYRIAWKRVW